MFQKYTHSNSMSKASKLYILVGVTLPLAVSTVVLTLVAGNLQLAATFTAVSASWSAYALYLARKFSSRQKIDKTHYTAEKTPQNRSLMRFEKIACLIILPIAIALLVGVIIYGAQLHFALGALWWIITSAGQLFYVSIVPDE